MGFVWECCVSHSAAAGTYAHVTSVKIVFLLVTVEVVVSVRAVSNFYLLVMVEVAVSSHVFLVVVEVVVYSLHSAKLLLAHDG